MTIDELKQLLAEGKITKEQFTAMAKAIDPEYDPESEPNAPKNSDPSKEDKSSIDIEKLVQQAVDRATNRLGNENKQLRESIEKMKKEKMTDEERTAYELGEREKALAEKERAIAEKEHRLYAIKAIKAAGLDDGSDKSLELVDFVMGEDEKAIEARVKAFGELVSKFVKAEVDKTFKANGGTPSKGGARGSNTVNPYAKDTYNLTEQMKLEATNPELAKQLQAVAGK